MIAVAGIPSHSHVSTSRQRALRRHSRKVSLQSAVRFAVDVCFRFRCRAIQGKALWSDVERVWLGSDTFLYWALWLEDIDIPWTVATAAGAPEDAEELRDVVHAELACYWGERLAALPRDKCPPWLPLP
jgi:hypothetical protein